MSTRRARLYFEEHGEGYPIVFVHELASGLRLWEDQTRHFSRASRCIAYNARGYQPSDIPEDPACYSWERVTDDPACVMRNLAIECAHVVGLRMGAYTALQFACKILERSAQLSRLQQDLGLIPLTAADG